MRFFLIDKITEWKPGERARAIKNIALSEDFFDDHFPLKPIMPGALIVEGMAQLSGLLLEETVRKDSGRNIKALMSIIREAKFRQPAYPGDQLEYEASVGSYNEMGGTAHIKASAAGELLAECTLVFSFHEIDNPRLEEKRTQILSLWLRDLEK